MESMMFPEMAEPALKPQRRRSGPIARVAIERSLDRVLDYAIPPALAGTLRVGQRVKVPLGRKNRGALGYVIAISNESEVEKLKAVLSIDDERVLVNRELLELARWTAKYYCTPLGTVIDNIIPAAVKKRIGMGYVRLVRLARSREEVQVILEKTRAPKRRAVMARLLQLEEGQSIELSRLAGEAGTKPATVKKLVAAGLVSLTAEPAYEGWGVANVRNFEPEPEHELNDDQQRVFDELGPRVEGGGFSVNLLFGVTGSGKTEIYLRCIERAVSQGKKALVLVPEIALTPQTVRRFLSRFSRVAMLHSGLAAGNRHRFWQQALRGDVDVVIGARSAVFAPISGLGIIVVDEEHEASYKQDTAPRYHARDVAIKRGQMEDIPVVLGSATPSMESWQRVQSSERVQGSGFRVQEGQLECRTVNAEPSVHHLLSMPNRVRGLAMPHVEVVDMRLETRLRSGIQLISRRLEHALRGTLSAGKQAILLLNRRGYSSFVNCSSCGHVAQCKYCDATMTYHRSAGAKAIGASIAASAHTGQLLCHYCLAVNRLPETCPDCGKKLSLFGLGTQRVEEELARKFPDLKFARVDSDSMHGSKDYEQVLGRFSRAELQMLLGTQMIAKGLDFPSVTLVGVISGDTALALPDFRAAERTFQLITQVSGRAGRGDAPGRVIVQTFMPDDATIRAAMRQDFPGFARSELASRREVGLPPFMRMVRIILREHELEKLHERAEKLTGALVNAISAEGDAGKEIKLKGPMPCAIGRIAGYHRMQILLLSDRASRLQSLLARVREERMFSDAERVAVDVDPISLL